MKRGLTQGYRGGCKCGFGLWGAGANFPNAGPSEHAEISENDPGGNNVYTADADDKNTVTSRGFTYQARNWNNEYGLTVTKDVLPPLWADPSSGERIWNVFAAKVPTSYPGSHCDKYPPISSATDGGDGTWQADLGLAIRVEEHDTDFIGIPKGYVWVLRSRNVFVDGQNTHVVYSTNGRLNGLDTDLTDTTAFYMNNPPRPSARVFGDTHVINTGDPSIVNSYPTQTLNDQIYTNVAPPAIDPTVMESRFRSLIQLLPNTLIGGLTENCQYPANSIYFGTHYAGASSYAPTITLGGDTGWQVARIKYEGTRPLSPADPDAPGTEAAIEVFASDNPVDGEPDLGKGDTEYAGDYIVAMFAVRCYKDSSLITEENFDEPYVVAVHKDFATTKVICSQWTSKIYRPGIGDETDNTGVADGTLTVDEVAAGEIIVDADSPPEDYPDETFPNLVIWCFNRCWDSVENQNVNLLLLTTFDETTPTTISDVVADFEQLDDLSPDEDYLDHGLADAGLHFTTYGTGFEENKWISSTRGIVGDDVAYTADGGTHSAWTDNSLVNEGTTELQITIHVVNAGDMTWKYRVGNRINGSRDGTFDEIVNVASGDNYLNLFVDGVLIQRFDNIVMPPDNTDFNVWQDYTLSLAAGTHTIRWSAVRTAQYDELFVQLDHITFPELMVGNDITGKKWWYWDGYELRQLTGWAWAARDEEDATAIASRVATNPHYITMDGSGRILIGNPHYVMRRNRDGTLDTTHGKSRGPGFDEHTGWVRFTSSPNLEQPEPSCLDPDSRVTVDSVSDPPWGAFQILPVGKDKYQVRGANASLDRDTTHFPFDKDLWKYKHPLTGKWNNEIFLNFCQCLGNGQWHQRCHSWTISGNGTRLEPHIEVLWRPTMHQPAWPGELGTTDAEYFPHPGYRTDFPDSRTITDWAPESVRWRDTRFVSGTIMDSGTLTTVTDTTHVVLSAGSATDNEYLNDYLRVTIDGDTLDFLIGDYVGVSKTVTCATMPDLPAVGSHFDIVRYPPRWSMSNFIIPRTNSDAWSRLPQVAWVRATSDGPADPEDINYWDPDESPATIAGRQDPDNDPPIHPRGGPWGSAVWVLVQARANPTGFRYFSYMYNSTTESVCSGHGPDEEDVSPVFHLSAVQRLQAERTHGMTDFDAIQCDCECCNENNLPSSPESLSIDGEGSGTLRGFDLG
jgi:hypothetical protein